MTMQLNKALSDVALIKIKGYKFLITDRPSDHNMKTYIETLQKFHVTCVVSVCEQNYKTEPLLKAGIHVYNLVYEDGMYPPGYVIDDWFKIVKRQFKTDPNACVAVHCIAGLGRAPVMVALTLIELGLNYEDAVEMIRANKRGAINTKQLRFLEKYRKKGFIKKNGCCIIQ